MSGQTSAVTPAARLAARLEDLARAAGSAARPLRSSAPSAPISRRSPLTPPRSGPVRSTRDRSTRPRRGALRGGVLEPSALRRMTGVAMLLIEPVTLDVTAWSRRPRRCTKNTKAILGLLSGLAWILVSFVPSRARDLRPRAREITPAASPTSAPAATSSRDSRSRTPPCRRARRHRRA